MTLEQHLQEAARRAEKRAEDFETGRIERVSLTLDRETIAWFKHQTGEADASARCLIGANSRATRERGYDAQHR